MDIEKACETINKEFPHCKQMWLGITGFENSSVVQPIRDALCNDDFLNVAMTQQEKDWLKKHGMKAHLKYSERAVNPIVPDRIVFELAEDNPLRTQWLNHSWEYPFDAIVAKRKTPQKLFQKGGRHMFCHYEFKQAKNTSAGIPRITLLLNLSKITEAYKKYARWAEIYKKVQRGTVTIDKHDFVLLRDVATAVAKEWWLFEVFRYKCGRTKITTQKAQAELTEAWAKYNKRCENGEY